MKFLQWMSVLSVNCSGSGIHAHSSGFSDNALQHDVSVCHCSSWSGSLTFILCSARRTTVCTRYTFQGTSWSMSGKQCAKAVISSFRLDVTVAIDWSFKAIRRNRADTASWSVFTASERQDHSSVQFCIDFMPLSECLHATTLYNSSFHAAPTQSFGELCSCLCTVLVRYLMPAIIDL